MIALENITCGYGDKEILRRVNLQIKPGELTCILAKNGIGKTTLFKTILGILPPLCGDIIYHNKRLKNSNHKQMASYISYVPQAHGTPFPLSVLDVVTMGQFVHTKGFLGKPAKKNFEIAYQSLQSLGIEYLKNKNFSKISGGEKQLVLIARAIAQQPTFIAMDEPTANLDMGNSIRVMKVAKKLSRQGYGIIMNTHSPDQALQFADQVIMLKKGGIMKTGTPGEILISDNVTQLYKTPVELVEAPISDGSIRKFLVAV